MCEDFIASLQSITDSDITISKGVKGETIHRTQLVALKKKLEDALAQMLAEVLQGTEFETARTGGGAEIEIPNRTIADNITNETGSGAITIGVGVTIYGLDHDIIESADEYEFELQQKTRTAQEKAREAAAYQKVKAERLAEKQRLRNHAQTKVDEWV